MEKSMKVLSEAGKWKVEAFIITMMALPIMKVTGTMDKSMVKVFISVKKRFMMVSGKMVKGMDMDIIKTKNQKKTMLASGLMG